MLLIPNKRMKWSINSILTQLQELPNIVIIRNNNGNATPLEMIVRTKTLTFFDPNFQLVLSSTNLYGGLYGNVENINRAIRYVSKTISDINGCILNSDESILTSESKLPASFL
jgi:hypothetical protein